MKDNLQFLCNLPIYKHEQPFELYGFPEQQCDVRTNCKFESKDVNVTDARLVRDLDITSYGFTFLKHKSACPLESKHFETVGGETTVLKQYLEETIELVKDMFTPLDVICFDWRFRRRDPKVSGRIPPRALKDIRHFALPTGDVVHCGKSLVHFMFHGTSAAWLSDFN
ncbi:hypothetical protein IL306_012659 [Fusarium sp. DS 682]|nr:hypothetical protein IL306_012659 [Fusarium sp. DS 682]